MIHRGRLKIQKEIRLLAVLRMINLWLPKLKLMKFAISPTEDIPSSFLTSTAMACAASGTTAVTP